MRTIPLLTALLLALCPAALAAPNSNTASPVVLGTTQLDGQNAKVGQTFTVGKQSPLNFTLTSAEFSASRVTIGKTTIAPGKDEKLLIVRFTVHNPQPKDVRFDANAFTFTAVDAQDVNHVAERFVARDGTAEEVAVNLKPAQKLAVLAVLKVPAKGVVPKLIVQREASAPVLRYDFAGGVKPLPAPFADSADTSGATSLAVLTAAQGVAYPLKHLDVTFEGARFTTDAMQGNAPGRGKRYLVVNVSLRNMTAQDAYVGLQTLRPEARDADGERTMFKTVLKASRDELVGTQVAPSDTLKVRYVFEVPADATMDNVSFTDGGAHTLVFDVKNAK
ncbi:hypothetical protein [Deinococcus yavapaiensis]|uniref:DUF4352 domain-containing protein n=1 Tax=Deinococcus yavapaiensis KR-236 TaxID=694435 RepID=A0A318SR59_9DEIO|nr:hypothetical protein [Deinococcus yavapaiensis]PYE55413.1 hypothetical protein DES52_103246 [Deinococcus yavapaiensis KR-236]